MSRRSFSLSRFLALALFIAKAGLFAVPLTNQIARFENPPPKNADEAAFLIHHYLFANQFKKAADLSRSMYSLTKEWGHLFNEALARTALQETRAAVVWKSYIELPEREQGGPRWKSMGEKLRDVAISGRVQNEDEFVQWIRECYYGKGFYTAWILTEIYEKYGGKQNLAFLRELRGDLLLRSGFAEEAVELYRKLYTERGDEYFLYQQARCYMKMNDSLAARGLLLSIKDEGLKNFNYYYILCRTGLALNMDSEVKTYMSEARSRAQSSRDVELLDSLKKI